MWRQYCHLAGEAAPTLMGEDSFLNAKSPVGEILSNLISPSVQ